MWIAKFKIKHKTCKLTPKCVKYKITDHVYLLNTWEKGNTFNYTELHFIQGKEENKKKFLQEIKKDKSFVKIDIKGDQIITLNSLPKKKNIYNPVFDPQLIFVKPWMVQSDGYEYWEVACWDKQPLMEILKIPDFEVEIKSIKKTKVADFFIPQLHPKLAPKQKEAIELAVKEGYYNFPRNIDLEKLAKISKVKRQTYQENLRRAEKKLVPFLTEGI
jgi:predicted DNA binding protein